MHGFHFHQYGFPNLLEHDDSPVFCNLNRHARVILDNQIDEK